MKPVKLKQRLGHAVEAFFTVDNEHENHSIGFTGETYAFQNKYSAGLPEKNNLTARFLKRAFLFFPAAVVLFLLSFIGAFTYLNAPFIKASLIGRLWIGALLFSTGMMTWYGIGELRNSRHCVIPLSIILTGIAAAVINLCLPVGFGFSAANSAYPFYFLPAALSIPFLAKGLADRKAGL